MQALTRHGHSISLLFLCGFLATRILCVCALGSTATVWGLSTTWCCGEQDKDFPTPIQNDTDKCLHCCGIDFNLTEALKLAPRSIPVDALNTLAGLAPNALVALVQPGPFFEASKQIVRSGPSIFIWNRAFLI
jgi:hypothetical protein